jgi:type II restriction enzyme
MERAHTNPEVTCYEDLITSHVQIRAGFIEFALEKNRYSTPYIQQARAFRQLALRATTPRQLLEIPEIRSSLLSAAGLSDKSLKHFGRDDEDRALEMLIENFLEPAGENFVDEVVYRFLLTRGDSFGGSMRNLVGRLGEEKFRRFLLAALEVRNIEFRWLPAKGRAWRQSNADLRRIEEDARAIYWLVEDRHRVFAMNRRIPIVNKNVDLCLFNCDDRGFLDLSIVEDLDSIIMLGELKAGIDPAGADERWKTGNTALQRIRDAFHSSNKTIMTTFVCAAIETSMAQEIFEQYEENILTNVANLSYENQMIEFCHWLTSI